MSNPEVTLTVFTYNQEKYVKESIESALAQDYSPLTIVISDDCSTDRTFEIIQETVKNYKGPHKIILNRNKKNMGLINHFNYVVKNFVKTDIFVVQAGDDISMPNRVSTLVKYFRLYPDVFAISSNIKLINKTGKIVAGAIANTKKYKYFQGCDILCKKTDILFFGPSSAYRKSIYTYLGYIPDISPNEDFFSHILAILLGKSLFINDSLVLYRRHRNNLSFSFDKVKNYEDILNFLNRFYTNKIKAVDYILNKLNIQEKVDYKCLKCLENFLIYHKLKIEILQEKNIISKLRKLYLLYNKCNYKELIRLFFPKIFYYYLKYKNYKFSN